MKYAFVTGGTQGIGRAFVEKLLSQNYFVIVNYSVNEKRARDFQTEMQQKHGNRVSLLKCDMSKLSGLKKTMQQLLRITHSFDIIIFNAGCTDRTSFPHIKLKDWQRVFDININVPVFLLQQLYPYLNNRANILFTGSLMGIYPHAMSLAYGVSKSAVHALVQNLVKFFTKKNIQINAIVPGFIDTEWQKNKPRRIRKNIETKIAVGRFGVPEEVAHMMWSVVENEYVNGQCFIIDGGYCYQ